MDQRASAKAVIIPSIFRRDGMLAETLESFPNLTADAFEGSAIEAEYKKLSPTPDDFPSFVQRVLATASKGHDFGSDKLKVTTTPMFFQPPKRLRTRLTLSYILLLAFWRALNQFLAAAALVFPLMLGATALAGYLMSRRILAPVQSMAARAAEITQAACTSVRP